MKIVMVQVIDTNKQVSDGITVQLPDGKVSDYIDLGCVMTACAKVIKKFALEAKEKAGE